MYRRRTCWNLRPITMVERVMYCIGKVKNDASSTSTPSRSTIGVITMWIGISS